MASLRLGHGSGVEEMLEVRNVEGERYLFAMYCTMRTYGVVDDYEWFMGS